MGNLEAALEYRKLGWSVIPLKPKDKAPLIPWTEYQTRLPTEKEIRSWWIRYPNANVGVVTGRVSNLVVMDVDPDRMPPHVRSDSQFIDELSSSTPVVSRTGKGGMHLFYSYPEGSQRIGNTVGKDGIDTRADGGIIALPPSLHPNGNTYKWIHQPNGSARSLPPPPGPPAGAERRTDGPPGRTAGAGGGAGAGGQEKHWLSEVLKGVSSGERNGAAARLAGYYFKKKFPVDVTMQLMNDWNQKNEPPLSYRELQTTIHSVYKTADRRRQEVESSSEVLENPFELVSFNEYMGTYGAHEINWIISDWMPDKTIAMMVAPPGTYKTWLELDLSLSIATGRPFLGTYPVNRTGPVIVVQQEDFHGQTASRLATILHSKIDLEYRTSWNEGEEFRFVIPPKVPIYLHPDRRLRFDDSVVMQALEEKVAAIRPVLVVIDPLYSAGATDDFMANTVQQMFHLKKMRDLYGCSFLLAHHTKKKSEISEREDAWGSQFLNAFLETGWQIRPRDVVGQAIIRRHFKVRQNIEEQLMTFSINTDPPYDYTVNVKNMKEGAANVAAVGVIELLANSQVPMSIKELATSMGVSHSTVSRKLTSLEKAGEVIKTPDGKVALAKDLWQE